MIHTLASIATRVADTTTTPAPPLRRVRARAVRPIAHRVEGVARHIDRADSEAVARDAVALLLASGYSLSVQGSNVNRSRDPYEIARELRARDGGTVNCYDTTGTLRGYVHLNYQGDPRRVLIDYAGEVVGPIMRCVQATTADEMR